jgi:hypothetical protein
LVIIVEAEWEEMSACYMVLSTVTEIVLIKGTQKTSLEIKNQVK